jgi:hypothetical protein
MRRERVGRQPAAQLGQVLPGGERRAPPGLVLAGGGPLGLVGARPHAQGQQRAAEDRLAG